MVDADINVDYILKHAFRVDMFKTFNATLSLDVRQTLRIERVKNDQSVPFEHHTVLEIMTSINLLASSQRTRRGCRTESAY